MSSLVSGSWSWSLSINIYIMRVFFARKNLHSVLVSRVKNVWQPFSFPVFWCTGEVQNRETKNRRLRMIVTSFQDFKSRRKEISPTFSYFLINKHLFTISATKCFEFIVFVFSESLSDTCSPVQAVLSNKRGKMFFHGFSWEFFVRHY